MNDFDKDVLYQTVYEFYDKRGYPTASKLRKIIEEKIGFSGSQSSILRPLRMGFRYRRCNNGRKFLWKHKWNFLGLCITFAHQVTLSPFFT
jgi:hypothetical protein